MLGAPCSPCCAPSTGCDFSQPQAGDTVTLSVESSVYGNSVFSLPAGNPADELQGIASKADAYTGSRVLENPHAMMSILYARSYFNRTSQVISPVTSATWARINNIGIATFCIRQAATDTLASFVRVAFQASQFFDYRLNLNVQVNAADGRQVADSRLDATEGSVNQFSISIPVDFVVNSVVLAYEFLEIQDSMTQTKPQQFLDSNAIPLQETITFRGLYASVGNQLMYSFAQNLSLP